VHYSLVYDASTAASRYPIGALAGLLPLTIGLLLWRFPPLDWGGDERRREEIRDFEGNDPGRLGRTLGLLASAMGVLILVGAPVAEWGGRRKLHDALTQRTYTTVEGTVSNFVAGQPDGHPMERFTVGGHEFMYSPYTATGFNRVSTLGGPMREGLRVRIAEVQGNIARLEIADASP
jgi:hypothetical protein